MQYLIDLRDQIMTGYGPQVFQVARALGILVIGWIVALAAQAFVRAALKKTTLDNRSSQVGAGRKEGRIRGGGTMGRQDRLLPPAVVRAGRFPQCPQSRSG